MCKKTVVDLTAAIIITVMPFPTPLKMLNSSNDIIISVFILPLHLFLRTVLSV